MSIGGGGSCSLCWRVNVSNWESEEDDLLVCTKSGCRYQHRVLCRGCMKTTHRKRDHSNTNDGSTFMDLEGYFALSTITSVSDSSTTLIAYSGLKSSVTAPATTMIGFVIKEPAVLEALKQFPQKADKQQLTKYAQEVYDLCYKAMQPAAKQGRNAANAVAKQGKNAAKSVAVSAAMIKATVVTQVIFFCLEVGKNLWDCKVRGVIDWDECVRRNEKAGFAATCTGLGTLAGMGIGSFFGPIGISIGMFIGGWAADRYSRDYFDENIKSEKKEETICTALARFGYGDAKLSDLLQDEKEFNLDDLRARYHANAYFHHPQGALRNDPYKTDKEKEAIFVEFYSMYDILLTIIKQRDDQKQKKSK
eukprot:CAMPEP_0197050902 /NCGR_PEP_ID=MMETSP1384-20130603/25687_1 /TAXON_ID=29189 /ORGANISM="Ammonia sp." /LENGTH=362 /DNA_ID=CAMNT_0042483381 /DNA_START=104 /DNA_END=1192 /DNA_ORIENTATION=+